MLKNYTLPRAVHHSAGGVVGFMWWALDCRLGLIPEIEGGEEGALALQVFSLGEERRRKKGR